MDDELVVPRTARGALRAPREPRERLEQRARVRFARSERLLCEGLVLRRLRLQLFHQRWVFPPRRFGNVAREQLNLKDNAGKYVLKVGKTSTGTSRFAQKAQKEGDATVFVIPQFSADMALAEPRTSPTSRAEAGKVESRGLVTVAPDIAVEIVSPDPKDQRRDRIDKLNEYAAFGIRYYWLVSPELRSIEVKELGKDGRYIHALDLAEGKKPVPGCAGLEIDVDELWREVERAESTDPT